MSTSSLPVTSGLHPAIEKLPRVGRILFGVALVGFGVQQLIAQAFIRLVPPLPAWMPAQPGLAVVLGVLLLATGAAILLDWKARAAAAVLAALILVSIVCLHIPQIAANPGQGFRWTNPCKALALFGGALAISAMSPSSEKHRSFSLARLGDTLVPYGPRLFFGIFLIICGIQHFVYADFVVTLIPAYIPGHLFWTYFCAVALIAGGAGVLLDATLRWAATLSGVMILLWVFMLHLPRALADLHQPGEMNGVFEALALSGVAFLLTQNSVVQAPSSVERSLGADAPRSITES
jgi:uncharacterized membrane protein YphA (DoxX/SURF4 family)